MPVGLSAAQQPAAPSADVGALTETQLTGCDGRALAECLPDPPAVTLAPSAGRDERPSDRDAGPTRRVSAPPDRQETTRPRARAAAAGSVTIKDFSFQPATITVNVGDSVTWTNEDSAPHSATADDGSFDTGVFGKGQSRSHTFTKAGDFSYYCAPHPQMKATVRVVGSDSSAGSDPQPDADTGGGSDGGGSGGGGSGAAADPDSGAVGGDSADGSADGGGQEQSVAGQAASGDGSLADTGADVFALLLLGLGLIGAGLAVRLACKRQGTALVD